MKYQRQAKILELVEKYDIETQDDLLEKLKEEGFQAEGELSWLLRLVRVLVKLEEIFGK